ncbi:hypothetical protein BH10PSE17_BH10PSE17_17740 [soil metagenome]
MAAVQRAQRPIRSSNQNKNEAAAKRAYYEGKALGDRGRWADAARCYRAATGFVPDHAMSWLRLADAQRHAGLLDEAVVAAQKAVSIDASLTPGYFIVMVCRMEQHRFAELVQWLELPAIRANLDHAGLAELGYSLFKVERFHDAVQALFEALARKLDFMPAYVTLGNVFDRLKLPEAAIESFRTAAVLKPEDAQVWSGLVHHSQYACRWENLEQDLQSLAGAMPVSAEPINPFALVTMPSTPAEQLANFRKYVAYRFGKRTAWAPVAPRAADEPLRIAYLSCDYYSHATASLVAELFEKHDRSRVEVLLYSYSPVDVSPVRQRL